jgi:23S rRNA (pseudouridine1915-N3)-methyltransferase
VHVELLWVGKARDRLLDQLLERYLERLSRHVRTSTAHVPEAEGRGREVAERRRVEADRLRDRLRRSGRSAAARVVALDERGRSLTTRALAARLDAEAQQGVRRLSFVIGGPDGLDRGFLSEADLVLSLSPLTFPHELARVIAAEQLYRCWSLLAGHPYHRD